MGEQQAGKHEEPAFNCRNLRVNLRTKRQIMKEIETTRGPTSLQREEGLCHFRITDRLLFVVKKGEC
jgi:hypothetical protein